MAPTLLPALSSDAGSAVNVTRGKDKNIEQNKTKHQKETKNILGEPLIILLVEDNMDHVDDILRSFKDHLVANKIYYVSPFPDHFSKDP